MVSLGAISVYYERYVKIDIGDFEEDFEEVKKLAQVFSLINPLEKTDIGDEITLRPTFINKNMPLEHKYAIIKLLKVYIDCFT
jgi:hypothetical protein